MWSTIWFLLRNSQALGTGTVRYNSCSLECSIGSHHLGRRAKGGHRRWCSRLLCAAFDSRTQKAGLLHSDHSVSISVVKVEEYLNQLDVFFLWHFGDRGMHHSSIDDDPWVVTRDGLLPRNMKKYKPAHKVPNRSEVASSPIHTELISPGLVMKDRMRGTAISTSVAYQLGTTVHSSVS